MVVGGDAGSLDQPHVRRHAIAGLQADDVAGDEFGFVDIAECTRAEDRGSTMKQGREQFERTFGTVFLDRTDDGIDDDDRQQNGRATVVTE